MAKHKQKLIIIDGNALIHRSFHALPPTMATKEGVMTNAVFGFTNVLLKAIKEFKPAFVALTLDKKGPTFRHEKFEAYKATRVKAPDELYAQIPLVKDVAKAFGIPIFELSGFEADDLIGTIAKQMDRKKEIDTIIVTGDMDTLQLVDDDTKVYTMSRGLSDSIIYDEKQVAVRYDGLKVSQLIDYKALRGDPSDNIPGVKGIGEKTAIELLKEFGDLDNLYKYIEEMETSFGRKTSFASLKKGNLLVPKTRDSDGKPNSGQADNRIKPRIVELLKEHKEEAYLSKELATIKCDVPIKFELDKARFGNFDQAKVVELLSELEFKSLLPRVHDLVGTRFIASDGQVGTRFIASDGQQITDPSASSGQDKFERNRNEFKYELVDDEKKFKKFLGELKKQKEFTFDTETTSFDPLTCELIGISFSWKKGEAYFVVVKNCSDAPWRVGTGANVVEENNLFNYKNVKKVEAIHELPERTPQKKIIESFKPENLHPWLAELKPIFENEKIAKHAHNMKYDYRVLRNNGIEVKNLAFDTMIASYLLNPGTRQHNLDALTFTEFGFEKISKDDLLGKGKDKLPFGEVAIPNLSLYSCEDADFTERLVKKLTPELKKQKLEKLFHEMEMPLVPVLAQMEDNGILVDTEFLNKMSKVMAGDIKNLEKKIFKLAGEEFNIRSTQQLKEVLFEKLEIPTHGISKTKTGFSTSADELAKLREFHPIIRLIQEYRELTKLTTTYVDTLPLLVNKKTGRLHTSYNQTITATGRLSSSDPNLQNIPTRTELGKKIRQAFIAEKGCKLVSLDYSQIELRLAAHMSGDKKMIKAFEDGEDIHRATAAAINGVKLEEVTSEMRSRAKATNFGILYGQGAHGLSQTADIPYNEARLFIDKYFSVYKDVKKYIDTSIEKARQKGYAETLFGRRRYLPDLDSSVAMVRKQAERMAINTPLQGTSADMIKVSMVEINKLLQEYINDAKMLLQVHDELIFEVKENKVKEISEKIKKIMENVIKLKVPVKVDVGVGDNWGEV